MKVRVEYFAILREQRGQSAESLETEADSAAALYDELRERHEFSLDAERLKVVVNEEFVDWDCALREGDVVVFIPPVAGG